MGRAIAKKLAELAAILVILSFLVFTLMVFAPGDPAEKRLTSQGVAVTKEVLQAERERMGLLRPLLTRYAEWAAGIIRGDWGISFRDDHPVGPKLAAGLRNTAVLSAFSLLLALSLALPCGILAANRPGGPADRAALLFSFLGNSLPNFLLSILLMYFFCIRLKLLPVIASGNLTGLVLPALSLAIPMAGRLIRQIRAELLAQWQEEYVAGLRARGVRYSSILFRNVLRNAWGHLFTYTSLQIGALMGGSVVVETIFRWPGLGKLVMDSIKARDYPVVMGFVLIMGSLYMCLHFLADLFCRVLDPRTAE